jgi:hypothetical protein
MAMGGGVALRLRRRRECGVGDITKRDGGEVVDLFVGSQLTF